MVEVMQCGSSCLDQKLTKSPAHLGDSIYGRRTRIIFN